jgi:nitric oxide reductase NorD protein
MSHVEHALAPAPSLSTDALEERLEELVDTVLSSRRTAAQPAASLTPFERHQQEFALGWVRRIAKTNSEMAYQFASHVAQAMELMDQDGVEAWIIECMDVYDKKGLYAGVDAVKALASYARTMQEKLTGLALEEIQGVLENFAHGLEGRPLRIEVGEHAYTDTETLFLPGLISRFPRRDDNFRLYKCTAVYLWAQTRFGTWRVQLSPRLARYPDPAAALALFHALESLRLEAAIAHELPGIHRDMAILRQALGEPAVPPGWEDFAQRLARPGARVEDTLALLADVYGETRPPSPRCFHGILAPEKVEAVMAARIARERDEFRLALAQVAQDVRAQRQAEAAITADDEADAPAFAVNPDPDADPDRALTFQLHLDGQPIVPPDHVRSLMESIIQDLGLIPDDYLVPAGEGPYKLCDHAQRDPQEVWKGTYHEEGAFLYNEWDFHREHYRKNWCVLREIEIQPGALAFYARTLRRHRGLVKTLRRTFEVLRGEERMLKRQAQGDDIDIDALVEAHADAATGLEMTDRLFLKMHREERNIAVAFMVDMSGSTKGWINEAEREALILLCESLETLGDRYAIYGFSGWTRKRCEAFPIKRFGEPYDDTVKGRICAIEPKDYTRMGAPIRHLSAVLHTVDARTKLLVTLSDGKPDDYDPQYRGQYGIEDTRRALIDAKREGIHPYCITIDKEGPEYLPHMYGPVNYTVLDEVRKLPLKVSDIYRRLTT